MPSHSKILTQEMMDLLDDLLKVIKKWEDARGDSIREIRKIADHLQKTKTDVNIAKVVGSSFGIFGAGVTLATGGLAGPVFLGLGLAGTATSVGAGLVGGIMDGIDEKKAQKCLDSDKELTEKVKSVLDKLDKRLEDLSKELQVDKAKLFAAFFSYKLSADISKKNSAIWESIAAGSVGMFILYKLVDFVPDKKIHLAYKWIANPKNFETIVTVGVAVLLMFNLVEFIKACHDLSHGNRSATAEKLRDVANQLEAQLKEVKSAFSEMKQFASENVEEITRIISGG